MSPPLRFLGLPATVAGMLMWLTATALEACMMGLIRHVVSAPETALHPLQIVFLRAAFGLLFLAPWLLRSFRATLRLTFIKRHVLRAVLQIMSMMTWFAAIALMPLADIAALAFIGPIFATIGATLLLGERVGWRRGLAMFGGFVGVLILVRPGLREFNLGVPLVLASAFTWGMTLLVIKSLSRHETAAAMTSWATILLLPLALVPAVLVWQAPTLEQWLCVAAVGALATSAQLLMGQAFRLADVSAVLPMDFGRMVWTTLVGYLFFAQYPDIFTWIGGAIVFGSATYVTLREAALARRSASAEGDRP